MLLSQIFPDFVKSLDQPKLKKVGLISSNVQNLNLFRKPYESRTSFLKKIENEALAKNIFNIKSVQISQTLFKSFNQENNKKEFSLNETDLLNNTFLIKFDFWYKNLYSNFLKASQTQDNKKILFEILLNAYKTTAEGYALIIKYRLKLAGVYIIYHTITDVCYIGESRSLVSRLEEHKFLLTTNSHFNKNLTQAYQNSPGKINDFYFLFYDFGYALNERNNRLTLEKLLIDLWPTPIFNIMGNERKK